ncbi:MAG: glycine cleavage system protein GcvH [Planctomycetes bacterium]|nr:glycine cleavage system protein GcvH [Planctomycetota bacterium]
MSTNAPDDRRYASSHEWAAENDGIVTVGITDFAVHELGDLVFIDLPEIGAEVTAGEAFGEIESVKAVSELLAPVSGKIVEVHSELEDALETLVDSPFDDGWLVKIEPSDPSQFEALMTADAYGDSLRDED